MMKKTNQRGCTILILAGLLATLLCGCRNSAGMPRGAVWSAEGRTAISTAAKSFTLITGSGEQLVSKGGDLADSDMLVTQPRLLAAGEDVPAELNFEIRGQGNLTYRNDAGLRSECDFFASGERYSGGFHGTGIETATISGDAYQFAGRDMKLNVYFYPAGDRDGERSMGCLTCSGQEEIRIDLGAEGMTAYGLSGDYSLTLSGESRGPILQGTAAGPLTINWSDVLPKE